MSEIRDSARRRLREAGLPVPEKDLPLLLKAYAVYAANIAALYDVSEAAFLGPAMTFDPTLMMEAW